MENPGYQNYSTCDKAETNGVADTKVHSQELPILQPMVIRELNMTSLGLNPKESRPLLDNSSLSLDSRTVDLTRLHDPTNDSILGGKIGEVDDELPTNHARKTTNCQTMMHLLKSNLGTGILAMPKAFSNAGILVGTLGIPLMGLICIHCMQILVRSSQVFSARIGESSLSYDQVVYYAFKFGPGKISRFSAFAKGCINFFLILTQLGFCCVYFVFVATSLNETTNQLTGQKDFLTITQFLCIVLPFMILLNYIRSLRTLAIFSTIANVLQTVGMGIIFYSLFDHLPSVNKRPLAVEISKLPLYFGVAIYAFEGIGVVLPLENEMKTPEDFGGLTGVLNTGMVITACLYTAMGFYGYLQYGDKVAGSITLSLPGKPLYESVRIMFAVSIFLSYAIQLYVPLHIIWPYIKKRAHLGRRCTELQIRILEYGFRTAAVLLTFLFAVAIPDLDVFISLVGALASSCLALIVPPLLELLTYWDEDYHYAKWIWLWTKNLVISIFGFIGFCFGTYASLVEIVNKFSKS